MLQSGHGSPIVRCRNATRWRSEIDAPDHPSTARRGRACSVHQRRGGRLSGLRAAGRRAELHPAEAAFDPLDEVVAVGVPREPDTFVDLVGELERDVVGVQPGGESDAGPVPLPVEVGGHDERLVRERIRVRQPGAAPGAELELSGAPTRRQAVGEGMQQHSSRTVRVDEIRVEPDADPSSQIAGAVAEPVDGAAVRLVVAISARKDADSQRQVRREIVCPAPQEVRARRPARRAHSPVGSARRRASARGEGGPGVRASCVRHR